MDFYLKHKTLKARDENTITEVFNYFVNQDMILVASFMQNIEQQEDENTPFQIEEEEKQKEMETDLPSIDDLDFDISTEAEMFYKNYKEESSNMCWQNLRLSNQIALTCLNWITRFFRKSKDFFALEKKMATPLNVMG